MQTSDQMAIDENRPFHLMQILILVFMVVAFVNCRKLEARSWPNQVKPTKTTTVRNGTTAAITCQISAEKNALITAHEKRIKIIWRWIPQNASGWIDIVPNDNVSIVDYLADNESLLSILTITHAVIDNSGIYACFEAVNYSLLDSTLLEVGYPPDKPTDLYCQTDGMLHYMSCCWDTGRKTYINTTYQLGYKIVNNKRPNCHLRESAFLNQSPERNYSIYQYVPCRQSNNENNLDERNVSVTCCSIDLSDWIGYFEKEEAPLYHVHGRATNSIGTSVNEDSSERPQLYVVTDPPQTVTVTNFGNITTHGSATLLVTWKHPKLNPLLIESESLTYNVRYRLSDSSDEWHTEKEIVKTSHKLTELHPDTRYDVQVSVELQGDYFIHGCSEWSDVINGKTQIAGPTTQFKFLMVEVIISALSTDKYQLELRWVPYGDPNSLGFTCNISISGNKNDNKFSYGVHEKSAKLYIRRDGEITVTGMFCNNIGCFAQDKEIIDLTEAAEPPKDVSLSMTPNGVNLTWSAINDVKGNCDVHLCTYPRLENDHKTIFKSNRSDTFYTDTTNPIFPCDDKSATEYTVPCADGQFYKEMDVVSPCVFYKAFIMKSSIQQHRYRIRSSSVPSNPSFGQVNLNGDNVYFSANDESDKEGYQIRTKWNNSNLLCTKPHNHLIPTVLYWSADCNGTCNDTRHHQIEMCSTNSTNSVISSGLRRSTKYKLGLAHCCLHNFPKSICFAASNLTTVITGSEGSLQKSNEFNNSAGTLVVVIACVVTVIACLLAGHCYRNSIKRAVRKSIWPRISTPAVLVKFADQDDSVLNNNVENGAPNRPSSGDEFDKLSTHEVVDSMKETNVAKINNKELSKSEKPLKELIPQFVDIPPLRFEKQVPPGCSGILGPPRTNFFTNIPKSPCTDSDHAGYSVVSPLFSELKGSSLFDEYTNSGTTAHTTLWRYLLYPKSSAMDEDWRHRLPRSNSYCGDFGRNISNMGSYVRYCKEGQGKNAREEQWRMHVPKSVDRVGCIGSYFSEPEITYTKLAVDPDGVPAFITGPVTNGVDCRQLGPAQRSCAVCNSRDVAVTSTRFLPCSCNNMLSDIGLWRAESWHDGLQSHLSNLLEPIENNSFFTHGATNVPIKVDPIPDENNHAGSPSYVLVPDNSFPENLNQGKASQESLKSDNDQNDSKSSSSDSIDKLYPGVRGKPTKTKQRGMTDYSGMKETDLCSAHEKDPPLPNGSVGPSTPEANTEDYVTVGQALDLGRSDRGIPAPETTLLLDNFSWRNDSEAYTDWSLCNFNGDNASTYPMDNTELTGLLDNQTHNQWVNADGGGYVTEASLIPK
ncbi:uncharacterized protein LOC143459914 isoform X3 [Clavelina lepadiformis]|uniref:uncharacterized protein LOC143459914 isoform X3 n=1 Tax=Clavelina lepadiformis TaxID=159417 RepID=UPI004042D85C